MAIIFLQNIVPPSRQQILQIYSDRSRNDTGKLTICRTEVDLSLPKQCSIKGCSLIDCSYYVQAPLRYSKTRV